MHLQIAISPCPNDTFIFDSLLHEQRKEEYFPTFSYELHDIEVLNHGAMQNKWDIVKISCATYHNVKNTYDLLSAGGAMGKGVGPLLIAKEKNLPILPTTKIGIPGIHTTAYQLLHFAYPELSSMVAMNFADIEQRILDGEIEAGVIIHENRFTYAAKGLHLIADLGTIWEEKNQLPVPLGCIVVKKTIDQNIQKRIEQGIKESCQMAWSRYPTLSKFVKNHAQEMDEETCRKHIELYVNEYTQDMGNIGRKAILQLNGLHL